MVKKRKEATTATAFGGGVLVAWHTWTPSPYYDARSGDASPDRAWIAFYNGRREVAVETVDALIALGNERDSSLATAAMFNPVEFADVFRVLLDLDRVISFPPLYDFMKDKYGFDPEQQVPRVTGSVLRFVTGSFRFDVPPVLTVVEIDLTTRQVSKTPWQAA
jgi:hypothetical protein